MVDQQPAGGLPRRDSLGPSGPGTAHMAYGGHLEVEDWHADSPVNQLIKYYGRMGQRGQELLGRLGTHYKRMGQHGVDIIQSMQLDLDNVAEVAHEDAKLIHDNLPKIALTLTGAAVGVVALAATAELAPEYAAVLALIQKAAAVAGIALVGANAINHLGDWLWHAWTTNGDAARLKVANKKFLDLVVVIAAAPAQRSGVAVPATVPVVQGALPAPATATTLPALRGPATSLVPALQPSPAGGPQLFPSLRLPNLSLSFTSNSSDGGALISPAPDGGSYDLQSFEKPGYVVEVTRSPVQHMIDQLPAETLAQLQRFGFKPEVFEKFVARAGENESPIITGKITPLAPSDTTLLPQPGIAEHARFIKLGRSALDQGKVAVVVLAGGMATRFGGVVKSVVPVADDISFLRAKIADIRAAGSKVPVYVMTSSATHDRIVQQVREEGFTGVECFSQYTSLRLTPKAEIFLENGKPSPHATGHGDLTFALNESGVLEQMRKAGATTIYISNVDNIAATLDPAVIGAHIASEAEMTVEVVRKQKGDSGGAPARVDGRPQIVEQFRMPSTFDPNTLEWFNTNSLFINAAPAARTHDQLPYHRVTKKVDGQPAIQFERLVGELTMFLKSHYLEVPRSRFLPVKEPQDLKAQEAEIREFLRKSGLL